MLWLIRETLLIVCLGFAWPSLAQEICDRPIPPEDLVPPKDDTELRQFLGSEYENYLRSAEEYINCLGREHQSIFDEMTAILNRWTAYYGSDAVIHLGKKAPAP